MLRARGFQIKMAMGVGGVQEKKTKPPVIRVLRHNGNKISTSCARYVVRTP